MARRPQDAVQFTFESAERIADVVRAAELATPQGRPLTFEAIQPGRGSSVRFAFYTATSNWSVVNFSGATNTNNTKTIQFAFQASTPFLTALCVNHLSPIPLMTTVATAAISLQRVLVLKENGMWRLIGAQS
jgi:hypothetical protein